jgi:hypothetical protein
MRTDHGAGVPDSTTFAQRLEELKREGANLLLVGDTSRGAHTAASRRLLEGAEDGHRYVFVFAEGADLCTSLPDHADPATTRVVVQAADGPGASGWTADLEEVRVEEADPSALASATVETVDALHDDAADPGDLRVCFDSITSLVRDNDSEDVFRTLHLVTTRVRQVKGLGHFHLRIDRDEDYVRLLEPVFDAVVELREAESGPEQRWHLRDSEVVSDWIEL